MRLTFACFLPPAAHVVTPPSNDQLLVSHLGVVVIMRAVRRYVRARADSRHRHKQAACRPKCGSRLTFLGMKGKCEGTRRHAFSVEVHPNSRPGFTMGSPRDFSFDNSPYLLSDIVAKPPSICIWMLQIARVTMAHQSISVASTEPHIVIDIASQSLSLRRSYPHSSLSRPCNAYHRLSLDLWCVFECRRGGKNKRSTRGAGASSIIANRHHFPHFVVHS